MARINFDDNVESQSEFWKLLPLVGGDRDVALGKLVRFFRLAQAKFGRGEPLSKEELHQEGLEMMIESGWAKPICPSSHSPADNQPTGYQAKGANKHFEWYQQKKEAAKLGGEARRTAKRDENGRFSPATVQPTSSHNHPITTPLAPAPALVPAPANCVGREKNTRGGILVELWQKHSGDALPKVISTRLTSHEFTKIRERLEENPDPTYWEDLIKKMAQNPYFHGKNKLSWKADFLWLIEPGNHVKIATRQYTAADPPGVDPVALDTSRWT
jgi:hypothetical protein